MISGAVMSCDELRCDERGVISGAVMSCDELWCAE